MRRAVLPYGPGELAALAVTTTLWLRDEMPVAAAQPLLRVPRSSHYVGRQTLLAVDRSAGVRVVAIGPGGLDQLGA